MNPRIKRWFKFRKQDLEDGVEIKIPKIPTKKQVIKSRNASNPTHKNKMQK